MEWNRVPEVSKQEGAFFTKQLSTLKAYELMLVQHAASSWTVAVTSRLVAAITQEGGSLWRHTSPMEEKSDWSTVSSLLATYSEECEGHNKASLDVEQGN